ncbi:DUF3800 domain-containing protein [Saccharopolyspora sp. HNM0986]|uniref:DUF3800 domain-containing protein n=1 Tax=Saccharopolyspora galaxeae TaxID=2781241 RepID=UPI00190CDE49|nr:DUF3800 domain-containing protein [Saccharopolyspora sp. HNM0986]MBK0870009.1 DUF3800 domain-containing protein [Saccharopolyspora sp. HNM0986]
MIVRVFYVDDSGSEQHGINVFGWVELELGAWNQVLRGWLDWRQELYRSIGLATDYELHATKFLGGRGRPTGTDWDTAKPNRSQVMRDALSTIDGLDGLAAGAVFLRTTPGVKHPAAKADAYARLVRYLDARLTAAGELGLIMMDGDGSDHTYRGAHRELKLATRSVIEDPLFQHSHHSQWVQMADLVAYAAFMRVERMVGKPFAWEWFTLLADCSTSGVEPLDRHLA